MTLTRSFVRNAVTTPLDARLMLMSLVTCTNNGTPRTGVLSAQNTVIVSTAASMNLVVSAAEFVVSKGKADGVTILTNDGNVNVAVTSAPASNSRIDVLWVKHNDNTTGDADSLPVFGVTAGVAAASPTKPAIPTGALELATLQIFAGTVTTAGGSNVLTNTYRMTAARGGTVPFRTVTDLLAWTDPVPGQRAYAIDKDLEYRYASGGWKAESSSVFGGRQAVSTQGIANGTITKLACNGTSIFTGGTSAGTNAVTVPVSGWYKVTGYCLWNANGTGTRVLTVRVNDADPTGYLLRDVAVAVTGGTPTSNSTSGMIQLTAGDTISIWGTQTSGGSLDVTEKQITVELVSAT